MRLAAPYPYNWAADFKCPHCGASLNVDDPDDLLQPWDKPGRDEDFWAVCPSCDGEFIFHVTWEPTYPYEPKKVDE